MFVFVLNLIYSRSF